mgnify:FL=1
MHVMTTGIRLRRALLPAAAATAALFAARRAVDRRAAARFYEHVGEPAEPIDAGAFHGGLPGVFHRSELSGTMHTASLEAVRAVLPSPDLHPVRLPGGRAIVLVASIRHEEVTASGVDGLALLPYGEIMVAAFVTRRPAPPFLPLVAPAFSGIAAGTFVLHMPVTSKAARDAGRSMGYPKFTADIKFEDSVETIRSQVSEGGHRILTHIVQPAGQPTVSGAPSTLYSVRDGQLLEQSAPSFGLLRGRWGRGSGSLELGDHQVADELRALDIQPQPFAAMQLSAARMSLPGVHTVGPAGPYLGYIGDERELGRYVVTYPGSGPIDRYAPYAPTAGPRKALAESSTPSEPELVAH